MFVDDQNIVSVNLVGSFFDRPINEVSDIDFVVILNELNKKTFDEVIKKFKTFNHKNYFGNINIIINNTFGPLKTYEEKSIVLHIMIYDTKGHIEHVINSPFTCFDWDRTKYFRKVSLKNLYSANRLMLKDFVDSRRGIRDYSKDLKNEVLSIRKYKFHNDTSKIEKINIPINGRYLTEYSYHIVKNLLKNYIKFFNNINYDSKNLITETKKVLPNTFDRYVEKLSELEKRKYQRLESSKDEVLWINYFILDFYKHVKDLYSKSQKIVFIRHSRTSLNSSNLFLGNKLDPPIINTNTQKNKFKDYYCITSPSRRAKQTAQKYNFQNIQIDPLLQEIDYGDAEGIDIDLFFERYPEIVNSWSKNLDPKFPNGENNSDVIKRIELFLKKLKYEDTVVITHQVFLRCLIGYYFNLPVHNWYKIFIPHNTPIEFIRIDGIYYPNISRKLYFILFKNYFLN